MLATRAEDAQKDLDKQAEATQNRFQQELLVTITALLDNSEKKLEAEGLRYGFPDTKSIFASRPLSSGSRRCCRLCRPARSFGT